MDLDLVLFLLATAVLRFVFRMAYPCAYGRHRPHVYRNWILCADCGRRHMGGRRWARAFAV